MKVSVAADPLDLFHPAVSGWFRSCFAEPTPAQRAAWPSIHAGQHTLVAAPTGSGKTLTAFLAALDELVRQGLSPQGLADETWVLYVSPLKALSNDVQKNLEQPLAGIRAQLTLLGLPDVPIRTSVRTGDTTARERQQAKRRAPHVLVTTPESLYVLLGSASGRDMLAHVRTVIIDEIHAVATSKRGSHLALSLERLDALVGRPVVRVGLSATQKPIDEMARFLVGAGQVVDGLARCEVVDIGYAKQRDLALELPPVPLSAVMSNEQWMQVYHRIAELAYTHRTLLVFVNTRRMAERAARHLGDLLGREHVAAHHGSLAREARLLAEQRLKRGELKVLVATASLELGLDIGDVDLVCQLGSPRSIAAFLQRAGRSGHAVGGVPKARLFPQSRDDLVECAALLDCVRRGELDELKVLPAPLDVLAQQIVAETANREWAEDDLYALVRRAWPYANLPRERFDEVVRMLAEGFTTRQGQRASHVHRDAVHGLLRERKGARMTALTSGGTIPETGDYTVMLEPQAERVGTVHEDFAVESLAGDVFQLGNMSYRILRIEPGKVRVEDAQGAAPNIPFWLGEAPGRSDELSLGVSRLRSEIEQRLLQGEGGSDEGHRRALAWLIQDVGLAAEAARQLVDYLARSLAVLGRLPTRDVLVLERFFDESGGMQLVLHSPRGSRLNRAWGLALRKRFCRQFNFELQAAATEDAIVLSLSTSHSFPLPEVARYLHSNTALHVLTQALLDAPMFAVRWRWNATTALALPRFTGGRKVAPQLQRMRSEDLLAAVFPDQVACLENIVGEREVPDHPLVAQTLQDCLHDAMDADGFLEVLRGLESGRIELVARDLPAPSPLAAEALQARPYAYLDDAPIEERRTQAVQSRAWDRDFGSGDLGRLDPEAIDAVRLEAWPRPRNADEMHEALCALGVVTQDEAAAQEGWLGWLHDLARSRRATLLRGRDFNGPADGSSGLSASPNERAAIDGDLHGDGLWVAAERLAELQLVHPATQPAPSIEAVPTARSAKDRFGAIIDLLHARLGALGPVTASELAASLSIAPEDIDSALLALQTEGSVLQGLFAAEAWADGEVEWCERHLLARIHRYTMRRLRREVEPVEPRDYMRFLFEWQHVTDTSRMRGAQALAGVLSQLEGYEAPAALWESELLPARVADYAAPWLDELCVAGRVSWMRLRPASAEGQGAPSSLKTTPVLLLPRRSLGLWASVAPAPDASREAALRAGARTVLAHLERRGASFFDEIAQACRMLPAQVEEALSELVVLARVTCDSYAGLRALLVPPSRRPSTTGARHRRHLPIMGGIADAGRWSALRVGAPDTLGTADLPDDDALEHIAMTLLRRYGVICWNFMEREPAWLPAWRELVRVYRRLEARGEIRGGRFIAGISGEQFALPEAVAALREMRRREPQGEYVCIAASDPANLLGCIVQGDRVPRVAGARVAWRDGIPVATLVGSEVTSLPTIKPEETAHVRRLLTLDPNWRFLARTPATAKAP